ncbi:lipopolysaccharide biosynthesis protein [Priestia megaterium]|uniref:lipopolysaccharide biosynthesis protein n=1 Tax=Priestia megaterium TaxID=1404 RepID=UPI002E1FB12A|nr:lipopolysaccharide biosynthesis protein [Priestia megaterium]
MNIKNELRNGILISAVGKYSNIIIQFVVLAILSRLLTPNEFGIVAIINVFLMFFTMLVDMGIGPAIIQNKSLNEKQLNGIFTFTILLSVVLSTCFALLARPIATFYNNQHLVNVCIIMSFALLTSGLNMVPQSVLLKQKRFFEINAGQVISNIVSGIVGITLALNHFSYYAIVYSSIFRNLTMLIIFYFKTNLKMTKSIKKEDLSSIYAFSKNQFLFNFINYFSRNLDSMLIGKFISVKALAYYDKAYMLTLYPNQLLTSVITPVVQPILSEYEKQNKIIKQTYLSLTKILAFIGMPLTVFLFFTSTEIIYLLFGSQWTASVPIFQILSLSIWIQMILSSTGSIFQSSNRTDLLLMSGVLSALLNISSIIVGVWTGKVEYLASMLVLSFLVNFIQANYLLMNKVFQEKQIEFYKNLVDPFKISILMLVALLITNYFFGDFSFLVQLTIKIIVSLIIFILGIRLTDNLKLFYYIFKSKKGEK